MPDKDASKNYVNIGPAGGSAKGTPVAAAKPAADPAASEPSRGKTPTVVDKRPTRNFAEYFYVLKHRHKFLPEVCIDVGAAYGTAALYGAFPDAFHLAFEPLPTLIPRLRDRLKALRHEIVEGCAMDTPGTVQILQADAELTSSVMHRRDASDPRVREVPAYRIDDVVERLKLSGPMLMKTDCQGADLLALKGATKTLEACEVVIVESSLFRFWGDHQADVFDIMTFMKDHGFVLHDILDGLFRPFDRALAQVDLAFVRDGGLFRRHRSYM
jgi:FkbM family methyltransferase